MIVYSESFIQFLRNSSCKIAQTLYRAYVTNLPAYRLMITPEAVNYLTFRPDGTISYLPAGKQAKFNQNGQWPLEGRQSAAPAKTIRKLFTKKALRLFKATDFECFCNSYKSSFCSGLTFKLLLNEQIPHVYEMERASGEGSLNGSCMNNDGHCMDIYRYCSSLRILILTDRDGLLAGRALVWQLNDITLLDRVYVAKDFMYDCFINYASEHGWWYKKNFKNYDDKDIFINGEGKEVQKQFTVCTPTNFKRFPYIDTFSYGSSGALYNYPKGRYTYFNADGTRSSEMPWDQITQHRIRRENVVKINCGIHQGLVTHRANTATINDQIWWIHDDAICIIEGIYHLKTDTVWSEYDNQCYLKSECIWCEKHQTYILIADSVTKRGRIYHRDDITQSSHPLKTAV